AQQHQRANFLFREWVAEAGRMTAYKIVLKRRDLIMTDMNVRQFAEACRDAVNRAVLLQDGFNDTARPQHLFASVRMKSNPVVVERDLMDVFNGEGLAVDQQRFHES